MQELTIQEKADAILNCIASKYSYTVSVVNYSEEEVFNLSGIVLVAQQFNTKTIQFGTVLKVDRRGIIQVEVKDGTVYSFSSARNGFSRQKIDGNYWKIFNVEKTYERLLIRKEKDRLEFLYNQKMRILHKVQLLDVNENV